MMKIGNRKKRKKRKKLNAQKIFDYLSQTTLSLTRYIS